jgi:hypothetical protein
LQELTDEQELRKFLRLRSPYKLHGWHMLFDFRKGAESA